MDKAKIRGELFNHTMAHIVKVWGLTGLENISDLTSHVPKDWYPLEEFCNLLTDIVKLLADGNQEYIFEMSKDMLLIDKKWKKKFKGMDPNDLFLFTENQKEEYQMGAFEARSIRPNYIKVQMDTLIKDEYQHYLWCEFYHGRIEGVLELTGHEGTIRKNHTVEGGQRHCTYHIEWE